MQPYFHSLSPAALSGDDLDQFLALGWYRMHQDIFTTSHLKREAWHRVHWLRFAVNDCSPRTSHKRILQRATRFTVQLTDAQHIPAAHEELYARYYQSIDFAGATSVMDCLFGEEPAGVSVFDTKCISIYDADRLVAVGYFDVGHTAAASILNFYDPAYARYSLGKLLILKTIAYLAQQHFEWYYPGYVVEDDRKMNYKLFLGARFAYYFNPESVAWQPLLELPNFDTHFSESR